MIIQTIEEAEKFVNNTKNFKWDGWNIIHIIQDDYAEYLPVGFFNQEDRKWYKKTVYYCGENGWEIPDAVIK